jgi:uncharacterized protein with HEPN domain
MNKLDRGQLVDMLYYAELAISFAEGYEPAALDKDERTFLATCKAIEIVGEAANQVSAEGREEFPELPWREAVAMRHRLVHGYRSIVSEVVIGTVRGSLPPLVKALQLALRDDKL